MAAVAEPAVDTEHRKKSRAGEAMAIVFLVSIDARDLGQFESQFSMNSLA
jgi:hypothetical protein